MPKYLVKVSYTAQGLQGLLKDGGSKRREAARHVIESAGATMESFYFAFGETDVYVIVDAPDNATVASVALTIGATGSVGAETVALLEPEEIDDAKDRSVDYTPPGG